MDRVVMCIRIMQSKGFHQTPLCKHWHPSAKPHSDQDEAVVFCFFLQTFNFCQRFLNDRESHVGHVVFFLYLDIFIRQSLKLNHNPELIESSFSFKSFL